MSSDGYAAGRSHQHRAGRRHGADVRSARAAELRRQDPVPLVLDWHGLGSSGAGQEAISGYKALSDQEGFIIAWPDGIDQAWNIGPCCTTSRSVDDLGFARAIVDDVKKRVCIDPKRVYADGYSMGGGMSHYLACNAADIFAAVAPSALTFSPMTRTLPSDASGHGDPLPRHS